MFALPEPEAGSSGSSSGGGRREVGPAQPGPLVYPDQGRSISNKPEPSIRRLSRLGAGPCTYRTVRPDNDTGLSRNSASETLVFTKGAKGQRYVLRAVHVTVHDHDTGCTVTRDDPGVEEIPVESEQRPFFPPTQSRLVGVRPARHVKCSRRAEVVTAPFQDLLDRTRD